MWPEVGTVNSIVFKTRFTSIGKKLTRKLPHLPLQSNKTKLLKRVFQFCGLTKVSIGKRHGKLKKVLRKF